MKDGRETKSRKRSLARNETDDDEENDIRGGSRDEEEEELK